MSAVRVAIVGAHGWAGSRHVAAFTALGAELAAVVDPHPGTREIAEHHRAAWLASADELQPGGADLVVVSLPTRLQPEVCAKLLERGFRVLEEKPIAADPAGAQVLANSGSARERLMVGYTLHHHPAAAMLREWLSSARPFSVSVRSVARKTAVESWRADPAEGGVLVVNGIHAVELLASHFGHEVEVDAMSADSALYGSGVPEHVTATLRFADGPLVRLETYWSPWDNTEGLNDGDWDLSIDLVAREGRFLWHNDRVSIWRRGGGEQRTDHAPCDLFLEQARSALEFVAGAAPAVGLDGALRATEIAARIAIAGQVDA